MSSKLKSHYKNLLKMNGPSLAAVQHSDRESQFRRFKILYEIANSVDSIVDVGCGLGDMYSYLMENNYTGEYLGLDFLGEFIEIAQKKYGGKKNAQFKEFDLWTEVIPTNYDYVLLSGVFNNKMDNNKEFMLHCIEKMFRSSRKGVAFNAMSTYVDYEVEELYYSNPLEIFDFCKKHITKKVVLKHDYLLKQGSFPFEYTIYLYKEGV